MLERINVLATNVQKLERQNNDYVGFDVLTAVKMESIIF
jgi:hypothetical protein